MPVARHYTAQDERKKGEAHIMRLDEETVTRAAMLVNRYGLPYVASFSGLHKSVVSDIYHGKENVSREKENQFRGWAELPLLPSIEKVEVPPGSEVKVYRPNPKRERRPRMSVPADNMVDADKYLASKLTPKQYRDLGSLIQDRIRRSRWTQVNFRLTL